MSKTVAQEIAGVLQALRNCEQSGNTEWKAKHKHTIIELCATELPSGSGWDEGTQLDFDKSTPEKLVFFGAFHHMHENGMHDGWTAHTITVQASLVFGLRLTISGRDRNGIKEYLYEMFDCALSERRVPAPSAKTAEVLP